MSSLDMTSSFSLSLNLDRSFFTFLQGQQQKVNDGDNSMDLSRSTGQNGTSKHTFCEEFLVVSKLMDKCIGSISIKINNIEATSKSHTTVPTNHQANCVEKHRFSQPTRNNCVTTQPMMQSQPYSSATFTPCAHVSQNSSMMRSTANLSQVSHSYPPVKTPTLGVPITNRPPLLPNGNGSSFVMENTSTNRYWSSLGTLSSPLISGIKVENGGVQNHYAGAYTPSTPISTPKAEPGQSNGPFFTSPGAFNRSPGNKNNLNGRCHWPYTASIRGGFMSRGSRGNYVKRGRGSAFGKVNGVEVPRNPFGANIRSRVRVAKVPQPRANIPCTLCDFSTAYSHSLDVHMKSVHSMERPFSCVLCDYTCKLKGNLKKHYVGTHKLEVEPAESLLKHSSNSENAVPSQVNVFNAKTMENTPIQPANEVSDAKQPEEHEPSLSEIYDAYNSAEFSDFLVNDQETAATGATLQHMATTAPNEDLTLEATDSSQEMLPADLSVQTLNSNFGTLATVLSP